MTAPRLTKRRTSLEKHKDEVIAFLLNGWNWQRIAEKYSVSRQAVMMFQRRHTDELAALQEVVAKQTEDYAIAAKVHRIAAKDMRWQLLEQVRKARAEGGDGMETGLVVRTYKALGSGPLATVVEEYKIDDGLLAAMDRLEHATAEELAQLPKPSLNIDNRTLNVFSIQIDDGSDSNPDA